MQEAEGQVAPAELKLLLRRLASTLDTLLAAITAAYGLEERHHRRTSDERRAELVERLVAGEPLEAPELGYGLEAHHLGIVARGGGVGDVVAALARSLGARLLMVTREDEQETWAWLGARDPLDAAGVSRRAAASIPPGTVLALGEPGDGPSGWRFSHLQARAALPLAQNGPERCVRYGEVALLATVLQDELVATSLRRLYFEPLAEERDGGEILCETLRAYFAAERNVSSAAVVLGIDRRTVANRLRTAEERIGTPLDRCVGELEIALQLDRLDRPR